jgi:diguanylate cyclase (GGDEF)-like protein/putative nucleotidyltransferase with HDIG domain
MGLKSSVKMSILLVAVACTSLVAFGLSMRVPFHDWPHFLVYLCLVIIASRLGIRMPGGESSISINFPFILLTLMSGSPCEAMLIAGASVLTQCVYNARRFTSQQILFNVANTIVATGAAWLVYLPVFRASGQLAPAVAAATIVYVVVNVLLVARMIGWATDQDIIQVLRRGFAECIPYYLFAAALASVVAIISQKFGWLSGQLIFPVAWACNATARLYMNRIEEKRKHFEELSAVHMRTIEALAMAIEAKDQNTGDHLCRVRVYVDEIGTKMNLSEMEQKALVAGSLLHDIGKLAVPEYIITKPGKLTPHEFEKMKIHPAVGAGILERVGFPYPVVPIVRSHHERWDGTGYPDGLVGNAIPIGARILNVVDCFDALVSDRPYRPRIPLDEAMAYVKENAGRQFDPSVVAVLEKCYKELEEKAREESKKPSTLRNDLLFVPGIAGAPAAGYEKSGDAGEIHAIDDRMGDRRGGERRVSGAGPLASIAAAGLEAQVVFELGQSLGNSLSLKETLSVMDVKLRKLIPFDCFVMYLVEENELWSAYSRGEDHLRFQDLRIPLGEGVSGWVAQSHKPLINGNPSVEPGYLQPGQEVHLFSALSIPLETQQEDKLRAELGVLTLYSTHPDAFCFDHLRILQSVIEKTARSIENSLDFRRVESDSITDYVTGLLNARGFALEVQRRIKKGGGPLALISCDLDNFKSVNDTEGHAIGDRMLRAVADAFVEHCSSDSLLARLGGDEFAALVPVSSEVEFEQVKRNLAQAVKMASRKLLFGRQISASFGVAHLGKDAATFAKLSSIADERMYSEKRGEGEYRGIHQIAKAV